MKVYIHLEWDGQPQKTSKLSIPSSWTTSKTVKDVIALFLNAYNSKNEDTPVDTSTVHLETQAKDGNILFSDKIIESCMDDRMDYYIIKGIQVSPASCLPVSPMRDKYGIDMLRCKNYGCNQMYSESENNDDSCQHHIAPPIFHDRIKGWQCCKEKKAYDWDEFQAV